MPSVEHLAIFVEVVSLAVDLLIIGSYFLTLSIEVVPVIAVIVRIRNILVSCCLDPSVLQHSAVFAYIVLIVYPCIGSHVSIFVKVEPLGAILSPLVLYHLVVAVVVVPDTILVLLPTCEGCHGSAYCE